MKPEDMKKLVRCQCDCGCEKLLADSGPQGVGGGHFSNGRAYCYECHRGEHKKDLPN